MQHTRIRIDGLQCRSQQAVEAPARLASTISPPSDSASLCEVEQNCVNPKPMQK